MLFSAKLFKNFSLKQKQYNGYDITQRYTISFNMNKINIEMQSEVLFLAYEFRKPS